MAFIVLISLFSGIFFSTTAAPAWADTLAAGQWYEIPNTAIKSVDPAVKPQGGHPAAKVTAWTSMAADTRTSKVYSVAGGGHTDYSGNEVDALTLEAENPYWAEMLAPTPDSDIVTADYYRDGRPASRHHYYGITFNETDDRIMMFGGARWEDGDCSLAHDSYNIGTNSYSAAGTHPVNPDVLRHVGGCASSADPSTGDVYGFGNWYAYKWTRATNSWAELPGAGLWGAYAMSSFDTARRRILILGGRNSEHGLYTLASNTQAAITLSGADSVSVAAAWLGAMVYIPVLDRFLVRLAATGPTVYQINPETFEVTTFTTAGGASIPATPNGPLNKFLYVPRLGGCVYVPTYEGNAWFLKIHAPSLAVSRRIKTPESEITAYPNPFKTVITFCLEDRSLLKAMNVRIYDVRGILQRGLSRMDGVNNVVRWNACGVPPGVYIARVLYNGMVLERKFTLIQ